MASYSKLNLKDKFKISTENRKLRRLAPARHGAANKNETVENRN